MANQYRERIYQLARLIPRGRVMTYGQIALILDGLFTPPPVYTAQTVGWAMHALGDTDCWLRVINSKGGCSTGKVMLPGNKQQLLLEQEGIEFDTNGHCDLTRYLWNPSEETRQTLIAQSSHQANTSAEQEHGWTTWQQDDFLDYITFHSRTERHLFHIDMIRNLYKLASLEYPDNLFTPEAASLSGPKVFIALESSLADALVRAVRIRE